MGIDIYARWKGQTEDEKQAQYTGFSVNHGHVGYLREAYHGNPYATRYLVDEAMRADSGDAPIPAAVLRERLPATVMLAIYRHHVLYSDGESLGGHIKIEGDFTPDKVIGAMVGLFAHLKESGSGSKEKALVDNMTEEQIRATKALIESRNLPDYALAFVDFVELCEKKEAETGEPCTIVASC